VTKRPTQRSWETFVKAHASRSPQGGRKAKSLRKGESGRETLLLVALATVGCEPARKQRPARAGTAPREGKALKGSSKETRAVCNKTAKRWAAKTVERGKNPEDGTDGGLATSAFSDGLTAGWVTGAPDVVAFPWEQEPQERRTRSPGTIHLAQAGWTGEGEAGGFDAVEL